MCGCTLVLFSLYTVLILKTCVSRELCGRRWKVNPTTAERLSTFEAVQELAMPDPIISSWITNYIVTHNLSFPLDHVVDGNTFCMHIHFFFPVLLVTWYLLLHKRSDDSVCAGPDF
jgi:hypothetical protein